MKRILMLLLLCLVSYFSTTFAALNAKLVTKDIQHSMTPDTVLQRLKLGNERFMQDKRVHIDFLKIARLSAESQHPIAIVLSCIDSRVPPEIIFDQNLGNIFVTRIAGNVIDSDVLGGMEYATAVSGAKLIVVLGHESCGAVEGACKNEKMGNLTQLLAKIQPAIDEATKKFGKKECTNKQFIETASEDNVRNMVAAIPKQSPVIAALIKEGRVKIVGGIYHFRTGQVTFLKN